MQKKYFLILLIAACLFSCEKGKYTVDGYFSPEQRDTLLADMITYIYVMPPQSNPDTRFEKRFRKYYVGNLNKFHFEKYYRAEDGTHYFYLIRPARSPKSNIRGVGGKFTLDENNRIKTFREVFNTPPADLGELRERGNRLFKEMIKSGDVNSYLHHPDYVEWPNKTTYYDTILHQWRVKPGV